MTTVPRDASIFVAGHTGLVGSAIIRRLEADGYTKVLVAPHADLDLRNQAAVNSWFEEFRPRFVFMAAGTVGGILSNTMRPAEFLYDNLMMHATVVHAAHLSGTEKLLYLGSSCIYPRLADQPIPEGQLLTGPLEPTNEYYAIAKIAGIKLCESYRAQYGCNFISAMPTNLYGPYDNFDLSSSHVVPALIRKFHEAALAGLPAVEIWGTGRPRREFLHVDDLADACLFLMEHYSEGGHVNVGSGKDMTIAELATLIRDIVYPSAGVSFDPTKPDGMPRKVLDVSRLRDLGWSHRISLDDGIRSTYEWYRDSATSTLRGLTPRVGPRPGVTRSSLTD